MSSEIQIRVTARDDTGQALAQVDRKAQQLGGTLRRVGETAAGMLAADTLQVGARKAMALMQSTIKAASDLGESVNAVQKTFGDASGKIEEFGKTAATEVGLSARAFNQMATPLGAILKNQGLAIDQVADETIKLTQRAADMASVFNTDVSDALMALQAGLRGETEPLRRYGVSLSEVSIQQKALAMSGKGAASELTAQEKAVARLSLIYEQSAQTAGDFKDTSDGLANSQRISAAQIENAKAQIGTAFLPIMAKAAQVTGMLANAFSSLSDPVQITIAVIAALGAGAVIVIPRILAMKAALDAAAASGSRAAAGLSLAGAAAARIAPWLILLDVQSTLETKSRFLAKSTNKSAEAQKALTTAIESQVKAGEDLVEIWDKIHGAQVTTDKELLQAKQALDSVTQSFKDNGDAVKGNSRAALENRVAMEDAAREAVEAANAYQEQTGDIEGAKKMLEDMRRKMVDSTKTTGDARKAVNDFSKELFKLPPSKKVVVKVAIEGALDRLAELAAKIQAVGGVGFAHGGISGAESGGARGGLTWVGERGPELVRLPYGSTVYPSGQSMAMASGWSQGASSRIVIEDRTSGGIRARLIDERLKAGVSASVVRAAYP